MDFDPPGSDDAGYWGTVVSFRDARKRLANRSRTPEGRTTETLEALVSNSVRGLLEDNASTWMLGFTK
mgnify:FL=1